MEVFIESKPVLSDKTKGHLRTLSHVALGSLFLSFCAQISIPLHPVPMTMQTLGVFLLAIMQGGKKASFSTLLYLALISLGLPVLANGHSIAAWYLILSAGYLMAFPLAAYVIGKLVDRQEKPSPLWVMFSIFVGQMIIYTIGVGVLMRFLSLKQSLVAGLLPFLPLAGVKLVMASTLGGLWHRWKRK